MTNKSEEKPSDRRAGKRKDRNQRVGTRVPELGYYLIVTDTKETEKNYFDGLRDSIPAELKDRLVIKVEKAKTTELVERALELANKEPQYRIPWIVFDRDQVKDFVDRIPDYVEEKLNLAEIVITLDNKVYSYNALNEFVIKRCDDKALRACVKIENVLLENYVGTGLIFSTPTGSTARNLSSGGSIVCPGIQSIQMNPIEPNRFLGALESSIIIPKEFTITIFSNTNDEVKVLADGEEVYTEKFDKICVSLSEKYLVKLVDKNTNFFERVSKKLI